MTNKTKTFILLLAGTFFSTPVQSYWNYEGEGSYATESYEVHIAQTTNITGDLYLIGTYPGGRSDIISNGIRAFYIASGKTGSLSANSSTISNASANSGGAFFVERDAILTRLNYNFDNNNAQMWNGGAIYSDGEMDDVTGTYTSNSANQNGGAIFNALNGKIIELNGSFRGNSAAKFGGALGNEGKINVLSGQFNENKAKNGGAVYNIGLITDITSSFSDNETNENGGAISKRKKFG